MPSSRYQAVIGTVTSDAGLMMDRARYLRANNYDAGRPAARRAAAQFHLPARRPRALLRHAADLLANDAARTGNWQTAFNIARQVDDVLPAGPTSATSRSVSATITRADLARREACARPACNRPASAIAMFDRYAHGGRSLQVQTKGLYWAGRASLAAGRFARGEQLFPARRGLSRAVLRPARA